MTELINSLKTFAYSGSTERKNSSGQLIRTIPLLNLSGRADSCNDSGFNQWRDAMRMIARLPSGIPLEFRLRLWENLSDRYMQDNSIVWSRVVAKCRVANSRDDELADQIEKDLHRTGCTGFSGAKQAMLKKVLVSYARWNPAVGYCQGFNMIGAMLLQMTGGNETLTLKVFIFLIEGVLPSGYFSQGLRGLAVDMAVFREILKLRKPTLNAHLLRLQQGEDNPPLTDVFTMHWFLTLFIHCLPTNSVLRIWDLVLLEGSEVLLRTALVLWAAIETRILGVSSADEFYSVMGVVTREMLEFGLMDPNSLVKCIVSVGPFPFPGLQDLRIKHRALIAQDTPHKSFFLAKRELDNLKRHYAAIRHRQRATTIILKGLEASTRRAAGQRSASLFVANTKKQVVSPKPKNRRASVVVKSEHNANTTNICSPANNNNNNPHRIIANGASHANNFKNNTNNAPNGNGGKVSNKSQVTMTWDKTSKKPKNFRRRRTASASSHTTSSSSSTELCDSSDSSSDSEGVWTDSDSRWKKKPKVLIKDKSTDKTTSTKVIEKNEILCTKTNGVVEEMSKTPQIVVLAKSPSPEPRTPLKSADDRVLEEMNSTEMDPDSKCIDTNDSQHFLEEMSRLGKSDSFYESLSQRICELQFQNLHILTTCNTVIEPPTKMDFECSPLPSPISPMRPQIMNNDCTDTSKMTLSPNFFVGYGSNVACSGNRSPCASPRLLSPRGSISSNAESPMPKSPMSPIPDYSKFRKLSKSSISSAEIPEILIEDKENIPSTDGVVLQLNSGTGDETETKTVLSNASSAEKTENCAPQNADSTTSDAAVNSEIQNEIKENEDDTAVSAADTEPSEKPLVDGELTIMDHNNDVIKLQTSLVVALENFAEASRVATTASVQLSPIPITPVVVGGSSYDHELVPVQQSEKLCAIPLDFSLGSSEPLNSSVVVVAASAASIESIPQTHRRDDGPEKNAESTSSQVFTFDNTQEAAAAQIPVKAIPPTFLDLPLPSPTTLKTAPCPCQYQTTEDVNAVIRENIAILQRLKLKPAYDEYDEDKYDEDDLEEYEDDSSTDYDFGFVASGCVENDSSDQDSGIPVSSSISGLNNSVAQLKTKHKLSLNSLSLSLDDTEGVGVCIATTSSSASPNLSRKRSGSTGGNKTKTKSSNKPKKVFNPFPTARKSRLRSTSKFGLYS